MQRLARPPAGFRLWRSDSLCQIQGDAPFSPRNGAFAFGWLHEAPGRAHDARLVQYCGHTCRIQLLNDGRSRLTLLLATGRFRPKAAA